MRLSVLGRDEGTRHIRKALTTNGYPKGIIQRHTVPTNSKTAYQKDTQGPSVTLPYVRGVSEAVRCILAPLSVKVSFQPDMTLRHLLMRPKDRVQKSEMAGVVYRIACAVCPATYVAQTNS